MADHNNTDPSKRSALTPAVFWQRTLNQGHLPLPFTFPSSFIPIKASLTVAMGIELNSDCSSDESGLSINDNHHRATGVQILFGTAVTLMLFSM